MRMDGATEAGVREFSGRECERGLPGIARCASDHLNALGAEHLDGPLPHIAGNEMSDPGTRKNRCDA
jgi:hypothetical protein